jgi:hypothetical protein
MARLTRTAPTAFIPGNDDIARRAFELYCARGCENGHDIEDWLQAERELREAPATVEVQARRVRKSRPSGPPPAAVGDVAAASA